MRTRTPKPHKVGNRNQPPDTALGDPPPTAPSPIRRGGHATPDRSRMPDIGAACHDTRKVMPAPAFTDELREGVELGTTRGNNEAVPKTTPDYANAVTEARHGQATRPPRPGGRG